MSITISIISVLLLLGLNIYTLKLLWTKSLLEKKQKWVNTFLCILFPFLWNFIVLSTIRTNKEITIKTKGSRKRKGGTDGNSLTEYSI